MYDVSTPGSIPQPDSIDGHSGHPDVTNQKRRFMSNSTAVIDYTKTHGVFPPTMYNHFYSTMFNSTKRFIV